MHLDEQPLRVAEGWGGSVRSVSRYVVPRSAGELAEVLADAHRAGLTVTPRGAGCSYGDAALNDGGAIVDCSALSKLLSFDAQRGVAVVEPGVTIKELWRHALPLGFWPAVVPGTQLPTLGGAVAMNIHGKNNFAVGPIGEHVEWFELATPKGDVLRCSRTERADVFHAAIGGFGQLGLFTKLALRLKKVDTGWLRVTPLHGRSLDELFARFEDYLPKSDYLVGWVDCAATGRALGRGQLHSATYVHADALEGRPVALEAAAQDLPGTILGVPKSLAWLGVAAFMGNTRVRVLNAMKFRAGQLPGQDRPYIQTHVAFAFLLDYVPGWKRAYGAGGLVQVQPFVPHARGPETFRAILEACHRHGLPSYLGVMKRHRPDPFLLTHGLDGWSLAMDFRVTRGNRGAMRALVDELIELTLGAGGRFYFAKDQLLRPGDAERIWGRERLAQFAALKRELDPENVLSSDLARRVWPSGIGG